jgi:hypothetical protein
LAIHISKYLQKKALEKPWKQGLYRTRSGGGQWICVYASDIISWVAGNFSIWDIRYIEDRCIAEQC